MDSAIPSDAELQSAEFALSALRKAVAEGEEAATRQPTADVERPAEPSVASPGPAWSLQEASKLSKKKTAIFLAYDGSGFSVRIRRTLSSLSPVYRLQPDRDIQQPLIMEPHAVSP
jgi:hypothetical protein